MYWVEFNIFFNYILEVRLLLLWFKHLAYRALLNNELKISYIKSKHLDLNILPAIPSFSRINLVLY